MKRRKRCENCWTLSHFWINGLCEDCYREWDSLNCIVQSYRGKDESKER